MTEENLHTDADRAVMRGLFTPAFWCSFVALSLVLSASSFRNVSVFPFFDGVFTYARDISITAKAMSLIVIGLLATFRPALLHVRELNAGVLGLMVIGCALPVALGSGNAPLLVLTSCALAVRDAWCVLIAGIAASRLSPAQASVLIPLAFVAQVASSAFAWLLPVWAGTVFFLAAPFAAWALSWRDARPVLEQTQAGEAPHDFSVTRPSSFLPLASQLFVCLFLFRVAFGCSLRFGEVGGVPLSSFFVILPVAVVAVWALLSEKRFPADLLVQVSVLFVVAGFLAMTMDLPRSSTVTVLLLSTGNTLFDMVAWVVLIAVASRNSRGAVAAFAWGRGVSSLGSTLGATLGVRANVLAGMGTPLFDLFAAALILLFVGYALIGLRNFSFREVIDGVTPVETAVVEAPKDTFDERCQALAGQYGLTPRELEVFQMLARGRDRAYIQEQLVVSRNTVKAHVKHIYAKLDIHSHQDLIDLVEKG
ncbi:helix-turn-helix transcriptional regulator [uncultured Senegalimassilia sp.]|uniref:helix-turn-helix transcriptional regulator n=1 Tax=uncultured Senegalimassilia sp. TaxID=1714350 RepID=UPI0025D4231E|nr:helix-turn-helix transcriptional regulator [uncultured Senegalimassilia sp.]